MKGIVFLGDRKLELREFPDPTPVPRDVILEATSLVQDSIVRKGLQLIIEVPNELPEAWIDRLRIRQVILKHISINGTGSSGTIGTRTGINGINFTQGSALIVQDCQIFNFTTNGIVVAVGDEWACPRGSFALPRHCGCVIVAAHPTPTAARSWLSR